MTSHNRLQRYFSTGAPGAQAARDSMQSGFVFIPVFTLPWPMQSMAVLQGIFCEQAMRAAQEQLLCNWFDANWSHYSI